MPTYDYECPSCNGYSEHVVRFDDRHSVQECKWCKLHESKYVMTMPHTKVFEPYHDESLNCDIYGERHRKEVMMSQGVQEAGDLVGGSRNFEVSANNGGMLPLQGKTYDDVRRNSDKRREQGENMVVGIDSSNAHGETKTTWYRAKDLDTKQETTSKSIGQIIREG